MKILQISYHDHGGAAYYLAEALRSAGHEAISARQSEGSYIGYKTHLQGSKPSDFAGVWDWADVVHVHDMCPAMPPYAKPKPTVITFHGSMYRRGPEVYHDLAKENNWLATVATIDLMEHGLPWMPDCRPDLSAYVDRPEGGFVVAHAPTSRAIKGTVEVIEALDDLPDIYLDIIEHVDYETCLARKGRASLYVDQFQLCYGLNAVEAWALGMPVIANAAPQTLARIEDIVGCVPFVRSELRSLRGFVEHLRDDQKAWGMALEEGQWCLDRFHTYSAAASIALDYYEQAQDRHMLSRPATADDDDSRLVPIRYLSGNDGTEEYTGQATRTRYEFSKRRPVRYVDERDARGLLKLRGRGDRPIFKREDE